MENEQWSGSRLGELSRRLDERPQESARLQLGVELAAELVRGCDHASVTMVSRGGAATVAATDEVTVHGDRLQYECGEGPCLEAAGAPGPVISHDLAVEGRWPRWSPLVVAEVGVRSVLSLRLYTAQRSFGSLNLYARRPGSYTDADVANAQDVAAQLAVAVGAAREIEQRTAAMETRTLIGQAQGVLMERFGLGPDEAFSYLRRISQHENRKLVEVAATLVRTRTRTAADSGR